MDSLREIAPAILPALVVLACYCTYRAGREIWRAWATQGAAREESEEEAQERMKWEGW